MQSVCLILLLLVKFSLGESDFNALLELKKGIQKDPFGQVFGSWDSKSLPSNGCPQNWYGIVCTDGRVTSITLNDLGLVGEFQFHAITGLEMLQNLSVSHNQFTGIVTNIGLIEKLKYLDLRSNRFSGEIMPVLSQLGSLVFVDLSSNQFSGSLDMGLDNNSFVSTIQYLNVSHNALIGDLFSRDGIPYFDSLEVFDASNNQLTGTVPSFNFVVSLRILRLGSNQLSGSLPEALLQEGSMVLSELDLSLNQIEGPLGSITSATLRNLNMSSNKLSGSLPLQVGHCAIVDLSSNMLSGNVSRIQNWGNYVEIIQLSSNSLTGPMPNITSQFLRLTSLKISNNSITGFLPPVLSTYPELKLIDLSMNQLNGLLSSLFTSTTLTNINLSSNDFSGSIPLQTFPSSTLVSLDLSRNMLSGHFPSEFNSFHNLMYLYLSNNRFEGNIPDNLPNQIEGFNVSYNNLSGIVPENLRKFPDSAFHPGNNLLIFPHTPSPPKVIPKMTLSSHKKTTIKAVLITGLVGGILTVLLLSLLIYFRAHRQKRLSLSDKTEPIKYPDPSSQTGPTHLEGDTSSVVNKPVNLGLPESVRKIEGMPSENTVVLRVCSPDKMAGDLHLFDSSLVFTAEELSRAPAEVIGRSCHGMLYKATLESGRILTVKWLRDGIAKGRKEFAREAKKLGSIRHPNLVSLQGYYWGPKEHEKLIISNYIDAPSLDLYLQESEPRKPPPLSLEQRLKVAIDVARCLKFLHNERAIPHGNLKSTNILLQLPDVHALLTDYSLHRIMTSAGTAEQVLNAAALGYRPPEFASSTKPCPSLKSDVYAFGVILLELLTGKGSGDVVPVVSGVVDLTEWVSYLVGDGRSCECFDRVLLGTNNSSNPLRVLDNMLQVALQCILPASERPDMKTVFEEVSLIVL